MAGELSARDRDLMIRTILGEAANEGPQGQAAVAHVILNRAAAGSYGGKSPSEVVLAPKQFEPWTTRAKELLAIKPNDPAYRETSDILDMVTGGDVPDPTNGATHFLNAQVVKARAAAACRIGQNGRSCDNSLPDWAKQPVATIGAHTFYAPEGRVAGVDPLDAINRAIAGN